MKKNVWQMPKSSPYLQRSLVLDNGHLLVQVPNQVYSMEENSPQGIWDHIADKMLLDFAESGCPIFRATTPLSRCNLKSKGHGKLSIHFVVFWVDIDLAIRKGLTFYQTRSNAIILQGTLPAYCIPKVVRLKTGEV